MIALLLATSVAIADAPPAGAVEIPEAHTPVHLEHAIEQPFSSFAEEFMPPPAGPTAGPDVWVYGYLPYWANDLDTVPWDDLSHVAIFDVELNSDGSLGAKSRWTSIADEAVSMAQQYGVRIHLTVTCFDNSVMSSVLPSSSRRAKAIESLAELVDDAGAHGVSVDFEGMGSSLKNDLVTFVKELSREVDEITVATPAVDWNGAYDYDALLEWADALFIMGYGYHWSSGNPGPVAPLYGSSRWGSYSLDWSVQDHLAWGAKRNQIILGLPLYGYDWPSSSTSVPGTATGTASAVVYTNAVSAADRYGRNWDSPSDTPYTFPDSKSQLWYDDDESIQAKVAYAVDEGLLGVGFWALNYDGNDPDLWRAIRSETTSGNGGGTDTGTDTTTDPVDTGDSGFSSEGVEAIASATAMAYEGDDVTLDGSASSGAGLSFAWVQTEGAPVRLGNADSDVTSFKATAPGSLSFDLIVTNGAGDSDVDSLSVEVVRLNGSSFEPKGCGCSSNGQSGGGHAGLLLLGLAAAARRRR